MTAGPWTRRTTPLRQGSAVIKDGDTIGEDANEKIKAQRTGSPPSDSKGDVMRLDYDGQCAGGPAVRRPTKCIRAVAVLMPRTISVSGYLLYAYFPFLSESVFRHFLFIPVTLVFGFRSLLIMSDKFLQTTFGLQAFDTPKKR